MEKGVKPIQLKCIDYRRKMEQDIAENNGFMITDYSITKNLVSEDGIYSPRYGGGINESSTVYRCSCGALGKKDMEGMICTECGDTVELVDNISYTGWLELTNGHKIIHPNLYKNLESIIGTKQLDDILRAGNVDISGNYKTDGYNQIGMREFMANFDEILAHFMHKKRHTKSKLEDYDKIMKNRDKVFIDCIPVFSTILRPIKLGSMSELTYTSINSTYSKLLRHVKVLNAKTRYSDIIREIHQTHSLQLAMNELYSYCYDCCNGKMGQIRRNVLGSRLNFTSRNVITPLTDCDFDQVTLPYATFIELFKPEILNILMKSETSVYSAYKKWFKATLEFDPNVYNIMKGLIKKGVNVVINRNPSYCIGPVLWQQSAVNSSNCWETLKPICLYGVVRQKQVIGL